ncbi:MAG: acyloxyacyl hydrolase [Bacteroidales bacterium]
MMIFPVFISPVFSFSYKKDSTIAKLPLNISAWYHHGYLAPHHRSMAFHTTENINGFEIITSGFFSHLKTKRPTLFGAGYYYSNLGNRDVYGNVHAVYAALTADVFQSNLPFYFKQSFAFGVSYNTMHFDTDENYFNRAVGSHLNAFVSLSFNLVAELGDNIEVTAGPSVVHTSNGNVKQPNFGLNLINTRVGFAYKFHPGNTETEHVPVESKGMTGNRYQFIFSGGIRQLSHKIPKNFFIGSVMADYSRRVSSYQAYGGGIDWIFDPTEGRETYVTEKRVENIVPWHVGVHLTWERIWNRFSLALQPGYKVITLSKHNFMQYNRAVIRYRIDGHFLLNIAIKAHGFRADFIEFGIGYELW